MSPPSNPKYPPHAAKLPTRRITQPSMGVESPPPHPAKVVQPRTPHPATTAQCSFPSMKDAEEIGESIGLALRDYFDGFWELTSTGAYVWHKGSPGAQFENTGRTRRDWFGVKHAVHRPKPILAPSKTKNTTKLKRVPIPEPKQEITLVNPIIVPPKPRAIEFYQTVVPDGADDRKVTRLRDLATSCKEQCGVKTEVQIMQAGPLAYVSTNKSGDAGKLDSDKLGPIFGIDPKRVSSAPSIQVALGKESKNTSVVVYKGQSEEEMHAEQHLLEILAEMLRLERVPDGKVYVGGYNCPCKVCLPVVLRFTAAFAAVYGGTLVYDPRPRKDVKQHGGGGRTLTLTSSMNDPLAYRNFVQVYNQTQ